METEREGWVDGGVDPCILMVQVSINLSEMLKCCMFIRIRVNWTLRVLDSLSSAFSSFLSIRLSGESKCHCSGRRPKLWLRLQQRHPAPRRRRRGLHQTGRRQSPRRQQQQIQHFLRFHPVRRLNCRAQERTRRRRGRRKRRDEGGFVIPALFFTSQDHPVASTIFFFVVGKTLVRDSQWTLGGCSFCSMNHLNDKKGRKIENVVKKTNLSFLPVRLLQDFQIAEIFILIVLYVLYVSPSPHLISRP